MVRVARFALVTSLATGCTTVGTPPAVGERLPARTVGEEFVVQGRFFYEDGDRLSWRCGRTILCVETLVRDERFQREIDRLQGSTLTLRVRRVDACGAQSSEVACFQSSDRTALRILEWLRIEPARP